MTDALLEPAARRLSCLDCIASKKSPRSITGQPPAFASSRWRRCMARSEWIESKCRSLDTRHLNSFPWRLTFGAWAVITCTFGLAPCKTLHVQSMCPHGLVERPGAARTEGRVRKETADQLRELRTLVREAVKEGTAERLRRAA